MRSSPSGHNAWVDEIDQKLSGRVKPLIRLVKAWKYQRTVPIRSFYLELRVAAWAAHEKAIVYSLDVRSVLKYIDGLALASMLDPIEIAGRVAACGSNVQLEDAKSKLATALTRAEKARAAELADQTKEAFKWWDLVFDGTFPAFGNPRGTEYPTPDEGGSAPARGCTVLLETSLQRLCILDGVPLRPRAPDGGSRRPCGNRHWTQQ